MTDKNWTWEEAWSANEQALKAEPERSEADPTLPFVQWSAMHELDVLEEKYKKDKYYLMAAIRKCANHDLPLPAWVANAYISAYDKVFTAREKSWDDVFGNPYPKGAHLNAIRKKRKLKFAVLIEVNDILKMNPDKSIDDSLFEQVGKKFNLGKTLTSEYYYSAKKVFEN
jgi:hypothetical protein